MEGYNSALIYSPTFPLSGWRTRHQPVWVNWHTVRTTNMNVVLKPEGLKNLAKHTREPRSFTASLFRTTLLVGSVHAHPQIPLMIGGGEQLHWKIKSG